jgi:hypothetical protein
MLEGVHSRGPLQTVSSKSPSGWPREGFSRFCAISWPSIPELRVLSRRVCRLSQINPRKLGRSGYPLNFRRVGLFGLDAGVGGSMARDHRYNRAAEPLGPVGGLNAGFALAFRMPCAERGSASTQ